MQKDTAVILMLFGTLMVSGTAIYYNTKRSTVLK